MTNMGCLPCPALFPLFLFSFSFSFSCSFSFFLPFYFLSLPFCFSFSFSSSVSSFALSLSLPFSLFPLSLSFSLPSVIKGSLQPLPSTASCRPLSLPMTRNSLSTLKPKPSTPNPTLPVTRRRLRPGCPSYSQLLRVTAAAAAKGRAGIREADQVVGLMKASGVVPDEVKYRYTNT